MKKILLFLAIIFVAIAGNAQFKSASLQAAGLTCAMCTKAINKALDRLPFISKVEPDIENSAFLITFKEGADIDFDAIKNAVEDAGFSVAKLKLTGTFNHVSVQNDTHVQLGGKTFHFLNVGNQQLNGQKSVQIVDRNFVTDKEFKKFSASSKMSCVQTGKAAGCCTKEGVTQNTRIYHVTLS